MSEREETGDGEELAIEEEAELAPADVDLPEEVREALESAGFVEATPALDAELESVMLRYRRDPEYRRRVNERWRRVC